MSYPVDSNTLALFKARKRQVAAIVLYGTEETLELTEADIAQGGLSIDRSVVSGSRIEIGSAVASELTLTLQNKDGKFNDTVFTGGELYVNIGVVDDTGDKHYIPMGYFTVDNSPRKLATISLTALDRMVLFDKEADKSLFAFPMSAGTLLDQICNICNVSLATDRTGLTNNTYIIPAYPEDEDESITYRQLLQWICEITGTCAYFDWDGKLRLEWYSQTGESITLSDRYSSDIYDSPITITGVTVTVQDSGGNDTVYLSGTDTYAAAIEGNKLIQSDYSAITEALGDKLTGFTYYQSEFTGKPLVNLWPLDMVNILDKGGNSYPTAITNVGFKMNGAVEFQSQGVGETENGYASANPLTKAETILINKIQKAVNQTLNDRVQSVLGLNEMIAGAVGLYTTVLTNSDGSAAYYYHTNPTLQNSMAGDIIYTFTSGGFAFSDTGWNGGAPVWQYGISKDGNVVVKNVSVYGVEASTPNTEYTAKMTPEAFEIWYRATKMISANADESLFTKMKISTHLDVGKIRTAPSYSSDSAPNGANIIYLD